MKSWELGMNKWESGKINWKRILLAICVVSFALAGIVFVYGYRQMADTEHYNQEYTFKLADIKKIKIDGADTEINFIPVDGEEIKVNISGSLMKNQRPIIAEQRGSQLRIAQRLKIFNFSIRPFDSDNVIDIYINPNYGKDVDIDSASKAININDLKAEDLSVNNVSGNIELVGVECETIELETASGEIDVQGLLSRKSKISTISGNVDLNEFSGDLKGSSASGSYTVTYSNFDNDIDLDTISGDITLKLGGATDFILDTDSVSGRVKNEFGNTLLGAGKNKINLDTASGNMYINK